MYGVEYREWLGKLHFWLMFIGVNVIFFPQHFLGLQGMPRRYIEYNIAFADWNWVSSVGYAITMVAMLVFAIAMFDAFFIYRKKAVQNPWGEGATTLEWTLPSPPPFHQFNELPRFDGEDAQVH